MGATYEGLLVELLSMARQVREWDLDALLDDVEQAEALGPAADPDRRPVAPHQLADVRRLAEGARFFQRVADQVVSAYTRSQPARRLRLMPCSASA
jgi:hypothetical protein